MADTDYDEGIHKTARRNGGHHRAVHVALSPVRLLLRLIVLLLVPALVLSVAAAVIWLRSMDDLDAVQASAESNRYFQDAFGSPLVGLNGAVDTYVPIARIPANLQNAAISIEDRRFRDHGGVDLRGIFRAMVENVSAGRVVEGGSTITQQLVKISYLDPERSYRRKIHEAMLSWATEARLSKDEILERYLNRVYLGNGAHGVGAAARIYFDRRVEDLSLAQCAALAAIIRQPSAVNPFTAPQALRDRATLVVRLMEGQGYVSPDESRNAQRELSIMAPQPRTPAYGGWFADWAAGQASALGDGPQGRETIRTTLNPQLQVLAERSVNGVLGKRGVEAALVALRPDGTVAAMVGGRDYQSSQFNRATQALRQPGSTFKLFVYLAALGQGIPVQALIDDSPVDFSGYEPQNYDHRFHGAVSMQQAFTHSLNVASVVLSSHIGYDKVAEAARALGISSDLTLTPSLALGTSEVTLLDLTEAYAAVATGVAPIEARGIGDVARGDGGFRPAAFPAPQVDPAAAMLLANRGQMIGLLRNVVTSGTGRGVSDVPGAVGKTGTTQDFRDAWFVGWNDDLIVGVWVGNDDNTPMNHVSGGSLPAEIWRSFMLGAPEVLSETEPASLNGGLMVSDTPSMALTALPAAAPEAPQTRQRPRRGGLMNALEGLFGGRRGHRQQTVAQGCNIAACAASYRSFRASDCSYQPYDGPRRLCTQ